MKIGGRGYYVKSHYVSKSNTGYWSKYGGGRYVEETHLPIWFCQSCNLPQVNVLPSYLFEYPTGEYIKICTLCRHITIRYHLQTIDELLEKTRDSELTRNIANLITMSILYPHGF